MTRNDITGQSLSTVCQSAVKPSCDSKVFVIGERGFTGRRWTHGEAMSQWRRLSSQKPLENKAVRRIGQFAPAAAVSWIASTDNRHIISRRGGASPTGRVFKRREVGVESTATSAQAMKRGAVSPHRERARRERIAVGRVDFGRASCRSSRVWLRRGVPNTACSRPLTAAKL
jgi:hypothetical protein